MERFIKFSKYRNIGLESPETLILNHSIKCDEIGDLVILIGPNNSGKSNILSGLVSLRDKELQKRDVTTLSFSNEDLVPEITFGIRDENIGSISYKLTYGKRPPICRIDLNRDKNHIPTKEMLIADIKAASGFILERCGVNVLEDSLQEVKSLEKEVTKDFADHIAEQITNARNDRRSKLIGFESAMPADGYWFNYQDPNSDELMSQEDEFHYSNSPYESREDAHIRYGRRIAKKEHHTDDELAKADIYCKDKYGIRFMPSIVVYQEKPLGNSDLNSTPDKIESNLFFRSLLKSINIDPAEIHNAYKQYNEFHNPAIFSKIEKKIDASIQTLNERFNSMYFAESDEYKFSISLSDSFISFGMARGKGEDPIMLEYQSTGFRWFFNFFFNFIESDTLQPGDIVIMDEPATNLHPKGQRELRRFIKEFAHKNGLTFIIATHSPFLIDPDNYDELRVVSMENNRSSIDNYFTVVNDKDPDSLLPIKEALTIEQNVLYDLDAEVVWVEGITDYNYLTMFKQLLGVDNIAFLPCNGIGADDVEQERILKRLVSIRFYKRNLLVDGDKAGQKMKERCKDTAFKDLVCISDLNQDGRSFKEIEDLFSEEDRKKFGLPNKTAAASYLMKSTCTLDSFTPETIENFQRLFELLKD